MMWVPPSPSRTTVKLGEFRHLPVGWKYGRGGPINDDVYRRSVAVLRALSSLIPRTDAFAGADGEVLLTAYYRTHYIGIIVEPNGLYSLTHEENKIECCELETDDLDVLKSRLREVAREIWGMFDSSTQTISTTSEVSSMTSPSRTRITAECRYSKKIAYHYAAA